MAFTGFQSLNTGMKKELLYTKRAIPGKVLSYYWNVFMLMIMEAIHVI